jgi:acetyl-CoA carboxylase alpha subunit
MTIRLPARLRGAAEHEARRIAQAVAERMRTDAPQRMSVAVKGQGTSGHALAQAVGRRVSTLGKGGR